MSCDQFQILNGGQTNYELSLAPQISALIEPEAQRSLMLNWTGEEITKQILDGNAIILCLHPELIGYVALVTWENYVEIGALIVAPQYRKKGIGKILLEMIIKLAITKMPEKKLIILPNKNSSGLALSLGFKEIAKTDLNDEIWSTCQTCLEHSKFPNCHCLPMIL